MINKATLSLIKKQTAKNDFIYFEMKQKQLENLLNLSVYIKANFPKKD